MHRSILHASAPLALAVLTVLTPSSASRAQDAPSPSVPSSGGTTGSAGLRPVAPEQRKVITLDQAFAGAASQSFDLRVAQARIDESNARITQAWSAVLPHATLGGEYTFNFPEQKAAFTSQEQLDQQALLFESIADITAQSAALNPDPRAQRAALERAEALRKSARDIKNQGVTEIVISPGQVGNAAATLQMPIFNGRSLPLLQNAYAGVDISKIAVRQARAAMLYGVARIYYQCVAAKRIVEIADGQVASSKRHLEVSKLRRELNAVTELALQRAVLDVQRAEQQRRAADGGYRAARAALGRIIGVVDDFDVAEPPAVQAIEGMDTVDNLVQRALVARDDVKLQREALGVADRGRTDAWMRLLPVLAVQAQGRYTTNTSGFVTQPFTGALTLQAQIPIFDGGMTIGAIDEANAKLRQELLKARQLELNIEREVRGTVDDVVLKKDTATTATAVADLAQQNATMAEQLFADGAATNLDVADAQLGAFSAQVDAARARLELETARLGLAYALGQFAPAPEASAAGLADDDEDKARAFIERAKVE